MVLKVLADAGEIMDDPDAFVLQFGRRADARQEQQLRRVEGAAAKDHLAARLYGQFPSSPQAGKADGLPALEQDLRRQRLRQHGQVPAAHHRMEIGSSSRTAFALAAFSVKLRHLVEAGALLLRSVEIGIFAYLGLRAGLDKSLRDGAWRVLLGDVQRAGITVQGVATALVTLRPPEIRQHILPGPAGATLRSPVVIVAGMAADIEHRVDGAGAAEGAAARLVALAAVQARLRHRLIGPVVDPAVARQHGDDAQRRADQDVPALAAGLDQANGDIRILAEPRRQRRSGRSAAGDHIVEFRPVHRRSPPATWRRD